MIRHVIRTVAKISIVFFDKIMHLFFDFNSKSNVPS